MSQLISKQSKEHLLGDSLPIEPLQIGPTDIVSLVAMKAIQKLIQDGIVLEGERLPSERKLADMLGISRTSLRDALKVLCGMGIVESKRGKGVFVTSAARHDIGEVSEEAMQRHPSKVHLDGTLADLFELREVLEAQAARWTAQRATVKEIETIVELFVKFSTAAIATQISVRDADAYDADIHELIARASGNSVLASTISDLRKSLAARSSRKYALKPERIAKNLIELGEVVEALKVRDAERAAAGMRLHVSRGAIANLQKR